MEKKRLLSKLSFAGKEENEEEEDSEKLSKTKLAASAVSKTEIANVTLKISTKKDPTIDKSFLPDKLRDEQLLDEKIQIEKEWKGKQVFIQEEELEITYSYWDGTGHHRKVIVKKGNTIGEFLEKVQQICQEFSRSISGSAENLLYIKEDLIIPHDITFYDLIVTKTRGKSGPLFHFDVHDHIQMGAIDNRIEKDESHPGKVVERRW